MGNYGLYNTEVWLWKSARPNFKPGTFFVIQGGVIRQNGTTPIAVFANQAAAESTLVEAGYHRGPNGQWLAQPSPNKKHT
jgi:hypothetical protein